MSLTVASVASRAVFWHFTTWLRVVWYVLEVMSVCVFAWGIYGRVAKWRSGQGGYSLPWREVPRRLIGGVRVVGSQRTVARRDRVAGVAHGAIFYGFVTLFVGTVMLGVDTEFTDPVVGWDYFHGDFYLAYKEVLNVLGTALIAGVLAMMVRRALIRPAKLNYT